MLREGLLRPKHAIGLLPPLTFYCPFLKILEHGEFKFHKSFAASPLPLPRNIPLGVLEEQGDWVFVHVLVAVAAGDGGISSWRSRRSAPSQWC